MKREGVGLRLRREAVKGGGLGGKEMGKGIEKISIPFNRIFLRK